MQDGIGVGLSKTLDRHVDVLLLLLLLQDSTRVVSSGPGHDVVVVRV